MRDGVVVVPPRAGCVAEPLERGVVGVARGAGCVRGWCVGGEATGPRGAERGGWYVPPVFGPLPGFSHFGPVVPVGRDGGVPVVRGG